ncbi:unnamed protein product [Pleuronectes platessa]|uniref:Uncharacterized protein n=1 Tax=Pleuronectes platessa TaxID=8262 RepID=A0A9N7Z7S2_PLEPL|nr:unnamed protein product [Pleuronectes platessa]
MSSRRRERKKDGKKRRKERLATISGATVACLPRGHPGRSLLSPGTASLQRTEASATPASLQPSPIIPPLYSALERDGPPRHRRGQKLNRPNLASDPGAATRPLGGGLQCIPGPPISVLPLILFSPSSEVEQTLFSLSRFNQTVESITSNLTSTCYGTPMTSCLPPPHGPLYLDS